MSIGMRIVTGLLALVALAGVASAQNLPCPECDADGNATRDNTYWSIDLGAITDDAEALADTDASFSHSDDERGFWAWLSLCLSFFVDHVEALLGVHVDLDANVDAYVSQDGIDLDATVMAPDEACGALDEETLATLGDDGTCALDFDRSELGSLDGETWEILGDVNAELNGLGIDHRIGFPGEELPEIDEDLCLNVELELVAC